MSDRIKRVNQLLKQEVSQLLLKEVDFRDVLVTVTRVKTSPDLKYAKINISVLPTEKDELALKIIERNIFNIQQELNKRLHLKFVPKIRFEIDQVEVEAQRIEEILSKIDKS